MILFNSEYTLSIKINIILDKAKVVNFKGFYFLCLLFGRGSERMWRLKLSIIKGILRNHKRKSKNLMTDKNNVTNVKNKATSLIAYISILNRFIF